MKIVSAEEKHIPAIRDIYAHHVTHGTASFETEPPDNLQPQTVILRLGYSSLFDH